jgi:GPH family glycoside/pentoside/hexuronide:cation symporter
VSLPLAAPPAVNRATLPEDVVPFKSKIAFGLSEVTQQLVQQSFYQLIYPIYNIGLGVSPAFIGGVLATTRLLDAFTDPLVASFSDNFRSRFGRRRPILLVGTILTGLTFLALFFIPRGLAVSTYSLYLAVLSLLFFFVFGVFTVVKEAFKIELTKDYRERVRVAAFIQFIIPAGAIGATWVFAVSQLKIFEDTLAGARAVALGIFGAVLCLGALPVFLVREHNYESARKQARVPLRKTLPAMMRNRPLLLLSIASVASSIGMLSVQSLGLYVNIYHVHAGDAKAAALMNGAIGTAYSIASFAIVAPTAWLAVRYGKRRVALGGLAIGFIGTCLKWWCWTPSAPMLMFVTPILMGIGVSVFWMLAYSMLPDITDETELRDGFKCEAMVGAFFTWTMKTGMSLAFLLSGYVLIWVHFDQKLGGSQPPETILGMRLFYSIGPAVGFAVAIVCMWFYPISEDSALATRRLLEARHQAAAAMEKLTSGQTLVAKPSHDPA